MSDHEFNNYLSLLAGLLRLGEKQRRAIAEELRTHLEDRLEELLARGMSREEATRQALAEFGDAAGLAAQFASISGGRRRRWLMRAISFSAAAMVLIAAGLAIFWPGRHAGPGAATVEAQAPKAAAAANPPGESEPEGKPRIGDVLNQSMDFVFEEKPLKDVAQFLMDKMDITILLNVKALNDAGVNIDAPVTFRARNLRLSTGLDLLLKELDLTYVDRGELIQITTPEDSEQDLQTRIYDCRDLLGWPWAGMDRRPGSDPAGATISALSAAANPSAQTIAGVTGKPTPAAASRTTEHDERAQRLMKLIAGCCDPPSWDDVGGPGSVGDYYGLFIISQTDRTHRKVERFLDQLREAAGIDDPKPVKPKVVR